MTILVMFMILMGCFLFDLQIGRLVAIFEGREDSKCRVVCSIVEDKNKEVICGHSVLQSTTAHVGAPLSLSLIRPGVMQESRGVESTIK